MILELLAGESVRCLIVTLLHTLWQGALAAGLLFVVLRCVGADRPNLRYIAALTALVAIVVGGIATWSVVQDRPRAASIADSGQQISGGRSSGTLAASSAAASAFSGHVTQDMPTRPAPRWVAWAAGLWLGGVTIMLGRATIMVLGAGTLLRRCRLVTEAAANELLNQLRADLRILRPVRLGAGESIRVPCMLGVFWPTILVPASLLSGLPAAQLRLVLAHELAHIRRFDYVTNLFQMVIEAILFFNPSVWWISRQIRLEREACCDALVVSVTGQRYDYAQALADVVQRLLHPEAGLGMAMALADRGRDGLMDRITRLLRPQERPSLRMPWYSLLAVLLAGVILFGGLWQGTRAAVQVAAEILSPKERMERIVQANQDYGPPAETVLDEAASIVISGAFEMADGSPLPDDLMLTVHTEQQVREHHSFINAMATIRDGRFTYTAKPGTVHLMARSSRCAPAVVGPLKAKAGKPLEDIRIILRAGYPGRIRVVDPQGRPIANAALDGGYDVVPRMTTHHLATDAAGLAVVEQYGDLPLGLDIVAEAYQIDQRKGLMLTRDAPTDIVLQPARTAAGVVLAQDTGQPVEGAQVKLFRQDGPFWYGGEPDRASILATTGPDGRFELTTLRDDSSYFLFVTGAGYRPELLPKVRAGEKDLVARLSPGISVRGMLTGPLERLPRRGGVPVLEYDNPRVLGSYSYGVRLQAPVDIRDGVAHFEIRDLWPTELRILTASGNAPPPIKLTEAIDNLTIDLGAADLAPGRPKRPVVLRFAVPKDSPPMAGTIQVSSDDPQANLGRGICQIKENQVRLDLSVGSRIRYSCLGTLGYWFKENWETRVLPGEGPMVVDIPVIPAGAVYGKLLEPDGAPARSSANAHMVVVTKPADVDFSPNLHTVRNADGRFIVTPVPLGGTYACVGWDGIRFVVSPPMKIDAANPAQHIELKFVPGETIAGQVTDPDGKPLANLPLELGFSTIHSHGFGCGIVAHTQADGRFALSHLNRDAAGSYTLEIPSDRDYQPMTVKLSFDGRPLIITLQRGLVLTGKVIDESTGQPVPNIQLRARRAQYAQEGYRGDYLAEGLANDRGEFRFSNLGPEEYVIYPVDADLADPASPPRADPRENTTMTVQVRKRH